MAVFFLEFQDVEFPALKSLSVSFKLKGMVYGILDPGPFNQGLSTFFSTARLPCLESLTISPERLASHKLLTWDVAPACSKQMKRDPYSIFPSLKKLEINGFDIKNACTKFLASGFYKRGCEIALGGGVVESGFDIDTLRREVLDFLNVTSESFDEELIHLGLYEEVHHYNLLSMEDLKSIAASVCMNDFAKSSEAAKLSMAKASEVSKVNSQQSIPNSHLVKSYENLVKTLADLNSSTTNVDVNGGASGSVGGGQRRRPAERDLK